MQITSTSDQTNKSTNPVLLNVAVGTLLLLISLLPDIFGLNQKWNQPALHSALEAIGGVMCVILSLFLINKDYYKQDYPLLFLLSWAFFAIGIGQIIHSIQELTNLFIFYHSFGGFLAGLIGLIIFFPRLQHWISRLKYGYLLIVTFTFTIYGLWIAFPDTVPPMGNDIKFSVQAIVMNLVAGLSFLLIAIKLITIQLSKKSAYNYIYFSLIFMILSISYLTFYGSALWDINWWLWHIYTLTVTCIAIYSVINYQKNLIAQLNATNQSLEHTKISLLSAKEELENKNKELEQFTYITSHDLQEPLNSILSFSSLLKKSDQSKLDKIGQQSVSIIEESAIRMKQFIVSLLEYSRIGRVKEKSEVNIRELFLDLKTDLNDLIQREDATIEYIGEDLTVSAYKTDLLKLFQNLIVNGIKYRKESEKPFIVINAKELTHAYQFSIADNGIGIEKEYYEQIFEVFRRLHTSDQYSGTGIGLAHCKKIVELHQGKIWLESTPGKGSKFYFTISKN